MAISRRGDYWVWVGGPVPPGSAAITVGSVVCVRRSSASNERLMRHEEEHVRQWRRLGAVGFLRRYLGSYFAARAKGFGHKSAYRLIPLEIEAEQAATRWAADRRDVSGRETVASRTPAT